MAFVKRNFLALIVFLCTTAAYQSSLGQGFVCDGRFFISLYAQDPEVGTSTEVYKINFSDGQVDFTEKVLYPGLRVNGLGFNARDSYIYGINQVYDEAYAIVRLFSDGTYQKLALGDGEINNIFWHYASADFSPDGYLVVHDRIDQKLHYLDVSGDKVILHQSVDLKWAAEVGLDAFQLSMDDIVFDPSDPGTIYTYQRNYGLDPGEAEQTRGTMLKIDGDLASPQLGNVSIVGGGGPPADAAHIGALFFSTNGGLYGYSTNTPLYPDPPGIQNKRLVAIDKETSELTLIGEGPVASSNDGCSCPFAVGMQLSASSSAACQSKVNYQVTITNESATSLTNVVFTDTLPDGMRIASLTLPEGISYDVAEGAGVGTSVLTLENFSLPPGTNVSLVIEADARGLLGTFQHQAWLINLPAALGETVVSDDPATDQPYDPTAVTITQATPRATMMSDTLVCKGQPLNLVAEGDPAWSFYWSGPDEFYSEEATPSVDLSAGQDSVYYYFHQQLGGCAVVDSVLVQVTALPEPAVVSDTTITLDTSVPLAPASVQNSESTYQWLPSEGLSCSDCANPIASPVATTNYEVTVSNAQGCTQVAQVLVTVEEPIIEPTLPRGGVHLPNAFSPNGDGRNDIFAPVANQQVVFHLLEVYNRWGEQVFRSENFSSADRANGWDGTYRGQRVAAGTYTFRLVATEEDQTIEYRGKLHLLY